MSRSTVGHHPTDARCRTLKPAVVDALLERDLAITAKHAARAERHFDSGIAASQQEADQGEAVSQMAPIRVGWTPPLQPWTEWAPAVDPFAVPLGALPRSSGQFTFESSGLPDAGRRSDGSAERRKRNRSS